MMHPTTTCPYCTSSEITIAPNWLICRTCKKEWPRTDVSVDTQQIFIALNQRITTLQDVLLEQQETISTLMTHFEAIRTNEDHIARDLRTIYTSVLNLTTHIQKEHTPKEETS